MLGPSDNSADAIIEIDSHILSPSCSTRGNTKYSSYFDDGFLSNTIGGHSLGMQQYTTNHVNDFQTVPNQNVVPQSSNKYNTYQQRIEQQAGGQTLGMNWFIPKHFKTFVI